MQACASLLQYMNSGDKTHKEVYFGQQGEKENSTVSLSWNAQYRNVLASGGSDKRIRVWDVATEKRKHKFKIHSKEVQCVAWNPAEASVLATASFDKTACVVRLILCFNVIFIWCSVKALRVVGIVVCGDSMPIIGKNIHVIGFPFTKPLWNLVRPPLRYVLLHSGY